MLNTFKDNSNISIDKLIISKEEDVENNSFQIIAFDNKIFSDYILEKYFNKSTMPVPDYIRTVLNILNITKKTYEKEYSGKMDLSEFSDGRITVYRKKFFKDEEVVLNVIDEKRGVLLITDEKPLYTTNAVIQCHMDTVVDISKIDKYKKYTANYLTGSRWIKKIFKCLIEDDQKDIFIKHFKNDWDEERNILMFVY